MSAFGQLNFIWETTSNCRGNCWLIMFLTGDFRFAEARVARWGSVFIGLIDGPCVRSALFYPFLPEKDRTFELVFAGSFLVDVLTWWSYLSSEGWFFLGNARRGRFHTPGLLFYWPVQSRPPWEAVWFRIVSSSWPRPWKEIMMICS